MVDTAPRTKKTRTQISAEVDKHLDTAAAEHGTPASVDVASLNRQLLGTWAAVRRQAREFVKDPALHRRDGLTLAEQRERVMEQLHLLVGHGDVKRAFPKSVGGQEDNGANIAAFGELVSADPSCRSRPACSGGYSVLRSCSSAPSGISACCRTS